MHFRLSSVRIPEYAFLICGSMGLALAAPFTLWLTSRQGLLWWVEAVVVLCALFVLLAVPLTLKILTGQEQLVFYRDVICIFTVVSLVLWRLHQPVYAYLDVTIAGAGIFHAFGRVGCLLAGCCYGRPCRVGVRYGSAHAGMGFPAQLIGVRLFPVQLLESMWILCLAGVASAVVLHSSVPGRALEVYVSGYAAGRFFFEFARGDVERPYWAGFSQAQWISIILSSGLIAAGVSGLLPRTHLLLLTFLLLSLAVLLVTVHRAWLGSDGFALLHPEHIHEIAEVVRRLKAPLPGQAASSPVPGRPTQSIEVVVTSMNLHLSVDRISYGGQCIHVYSLSRKQGRLSLRCVHLLGRLISHLQHSSGKFKVHQGSNGVAHVLFAAATTEAGPAQALSVTRTSNQLSSVGAR